MKYSNTGFFARVYEIVAQIPNGKVTTYGTIARIMGTPRASRIVGYAMASAPEYLGLPCHRVVTKDGSMASGNIFGGDEKQRRMLKMEGVVFKKNGKIDMEKCLWKR